MKSNKDYNKGQMTLTDRVAIEIGLAKKDSFAKIGEVLGKHPATISREIKENRTLVPSAFPFGNDCKYYASCCRTNMCGSDSYACKHKCKKCMGFNCHDECSKYESSECTKTS